MLTLGGIVPPTLVLFSVTMAGGAVLTFAPQLTDSATAALVLLVMGLTAALSRWLIGAVADRRGARPFLAPMLTCAAAAMAVCASAVAWEQRVVLIAAAAVLALCYGSLQNLTLIASAVWNIGLDTGTASGAVLTGVLATAYSFPVALATMAAFCLLTAVVAVIVPARG